MPIELNECISSSNLLMAISHSSYSNEWTGLYFIDVFFLTDSRSISKFFISSLILLSKPLWSFWVAKISEKTFETS